MLFVVNGTRSSERTRLLSSYELYIRKNSDVITPKNIAQQIPMQFVFTKQLIKSKDFVLHQRATKFTEKFENIICREIFSIVKKCMFKKTL
jgi:hypothetical protein